MPRKKTQKLAKVALSFTCLEPIYQCLLKYKREIEMEQGMTVTFSRVINAALSGYFYGNPREFSEGEFNHRKYIINMNRLTLQQKRWLKNASEYVQEHPIPVIKVAPENANERLLAEFDSQAEEDSE